MRLVVVGLARCRFSLAVGGLGSLSRLQRAHMFVASMMCLLVVTVLKTIDSTSCPWDLAEFGGVARYASHWALGTVDGGSGKCFPAGHASAGFAFIGGYFVLRRNRPRAARIWLGSVLAAGFALGFSQQMRGAHFQSHTLWTGWLCWTSAWLIDVALKRVAFPDASAARVVGATETS